MQLYIYLVYVQQSLESAMDLKTIYNEKMYD